MTPPRETSLALPLGQVYSAVSVPINMLTMLGRPLSIASPRGECPESLVIGIASVAMGAGLAGRRSKRLAAKSPVSFRKLKVAL
jgi:hypothetical protein